MSVVTTADERLDDAKKHLKDAVKALDEFLDEDTWGHNDFSRDYVKEMHKVNRKLQKLRLRF